MSASNVGYRLIHLVDDGSAPILQANAFKVPRGMMLIGLSVYVYDSVTPTTIGYCSEVDLLNTQAWNDTGATWVREMDQFARGWILSQAKPNEVLRWLYEGLLVRKLVNMGYDVEFNYIPQGEVLRGYKGANVTLLMAYDKREKTA